MIEMLFGGVFLVFTIVLIPIIIKFWSGEKKFNQNKVQCNATIVGYSDDDSKWITPTVILETDVSRKLHSCRSKHVKFSTFTYGTEVRVEYCIRKAFGKNWYDVRMVDPKYAPYPARDTMTILCVIAVVLLTTSIVMFMIGIRTL